jgi:hypothetical protein
MLYEVHSVAQCSLFNDYISRKIDLERESAQDMIQELVVSFMEERNGLDQRSAIVTDNIL